MVPQVFLGCILRESGEVEGCYVFLVPPVCSIVALSLSIPIPDIVPTGILSQSDSLPPTVSHSLSLIYISLLLLLLNKRELSFSIGKGNKEFDLSTEYHFDVIILRVLKYTILMLTSKSPFKSIC